MTKTQEFSKLQDDPGILDKIIGSITDLFPRLVRAIFMSNSRITPESLRKKYPNLTSEQIADKIIRNAKISVGAVGFLSGLSNIIPNPITLPISVIADFSTCTTIQLDTLNKVALAYGKVYDLTDPEDEIEIMLSIMGANGFNAAVKAFSPKLSQEVAKQVIAKTLPKTFGEKFLLYFGRVTAKEALRRSISKWMPMGIGSIIGSSANVIFISLWSRWLKSKFKIMGILRDELNLSKSLGIENSSLSDFDQSELNYLYHILWDLSEFNEKISEHSNAFLSGFQSITKVEVNPDLKRSIESINNKLDLFNSDKKKNILIDLCYFMAATIDKKFHKEIKDKINSTLSTKDFNEKKLKKYISLIK